jgi:hypothetical protein
MGLGEGGGEGDTEVEGRREGVRADELEEREEAEPRSNSARARAHTLGRRRAMTGTRS